jgi:uncharacterized protein YhaN
VKLLRLDLIAYGTFNGETLDLSGGDHGLHIVYGPNEAGKSTALRALRHLLYGIPERSGDAFRHPFAKLRVGGTLRSADGRTLEVVRRKGRVGTLRRPDEEVVPEAELQQFLNGVDAGFFATMFGIGHGDLVAGGAEIVRGGGDLGRLLFAAGSGAAPLGRVLDALTAESDALFRPAGQKQRINAAVAELKHRRAELAAVQLMGTEWVRHDQALRAALSAKAEVEAELLAVQRRLHRLQRVAEAHPVIAARRETLKALDALAGAARLPAAASERRAQALTRLQVAEAEQERTRVALAGLRAAAAGLGDPQAVLSQAERVEDAYQDLGSQRKAARDRIGLQTRHSTHRSEARRILRSLREDLPLEEAERLRVRRTEAVRIGELGAEYERIAGRIESARGLAPGLAQQADASAAALRALPAARPVEDLRRRLAAVEPSLSAERQLPAACAEAERHLSGCADALARLGLSALEPREIDRVAAPAEETVLVFQERFDRLEHRSAAVDEEARRTAERRSEIERRLAETRMEREVPTEADLVSARAARDGAWREVRARLQAGAAGGPADAAALAEGFEAALRRADEVADRLRREADRVAEKARLLAEGEALRERSAALHAEREAVQAELLRAAEAWAARWRGVPVRPGTPREMHRWLSELARVREKTAHALERRGRCAQLEAETAAARRELADGLNAIGEAAADGEALSELVSRTRAILAAEDDRLRRRAELEREQARLRSELTAAEARRRSDEADLARWQAEWARAVAPLGVGADARPAEATAVIEELTRLFDHLREADILHQRLEGIERDAEGFRRKVALLAGELAPELARAPAEEAVLEMQRRLTAAREAQSRRSELGRQIETAEERLQRAAATIADARAELSALCAEAGCATPADLPAAERRSAERQELESRLARENERLLQLGGGAGVDEFVREVSGVDPDGIGGEIGRLQEEVRGLTARRSELDQAIGGERSELARMDGSDRAARIAEEIQAILGGLRRDVDRYARARIAGRVLSRAIERFRERSQGPILRRAGALFGRLTCGSFESLRAELGTDGRPVIAGVRPGGETVPVEGLSDGTADQLFLALRLAGLEHYLDANEAMPFVVDDILLQFDDGRAAAALQALAGLSARTQVIFFTHHRHLLELAARTLDPAALFVHRLPPTQSVATPRMPH